MPDAYRLTKDDVATIRNLIAVFRELVIFRYADIGEIIASLPARLDLLEIAVRESSEDEANAVKELAARLKRLEELELLRQIGREGAAEAKKQRANIRAEHSIEHLQEMLITTTRNLQWAEMKKVRAGLNVSIETLNEIEEFTAAKGEIESQLTALKKKRKHYEG